VFYSKRYILFFGGLLGACNVIQDGGQYGRYFGKQKIEIIKNLSKFIRIYQKIEIIKKRKKLKVFDDNHVKYDITKHCLL